MIKGFSLIEIAIAIIILGIIAGFALFIITIHLERARWAEAKMILDILRNAQLRHKITHGFYCGDYEFPFECLDIDITPSKYFRYEITADTNRLAIATRKDGILAHHGFSITEKGDFLYPDYIPKWVRD